MLTEALSQSMTLDNISNFSSTYYVATRVFKPLFAQVLGNKIDIADTDMDFNKFFSLLPAVGHYGVQKLFVFRKNMDKFACL